MVHLRNRRTKGAIQVSSRVLVHQPANDPGAPCRARRPPGATSDHRLFLYDVSYHASPRLYHVWSSVHEGSTGTVNVSCLPDVLGPCLFPFRVSYVLSYLETVLTRSPRVLGSLQTRERTRSCTKNCRSVCLMSHHPPPCSAFRRWPRKVMSLCPSGRRCTEVDAPLCTRMGRRPISPNCASHIL